MTSPPSLSRFFLFAILLSMTAARARSESAPASVKIEYDQGVEMRDGVRLSADVFRPDAPGKYPVVLVRTPYDNASPGYARQGVYFASHGFVYVVQDVRGRGESEGEFYPLVYEAEDGYDTQTWCGTQPWSNGKVGTTGGSYLGWTQVYPAGLRNPYLAAMVSMVTPPDPARNFPVQHGVYQPTTVSWLAYISGKTLQDTSHIDLMSAYWALPLNEIDERFGRHIQAWRDWFDHPLLDDYWKQQSYQESLLDATVPILHVSGWYDDVLVGTMENFVNLTTRATTPDEGNRQWLLVGPWGHHVNSTRRLGEIDFGPEALIDLDALQVEWFDHWLKGESNGVSSWPKARIFVMGENRWRDENEWPLARMTKVDFFLHSGGRANSRFGDGSLDRNPPAEEPTDSFRYDPKDPVPFITDPNFSQIGGPDDYRAIERRDDVLVYSTAALEEPLEVCGPLEVTLHAASSAPDTDWTAKVLDVHPDGFAQRLNDGIVRARYRDTTESATFLEPGKVSSYRIDAWATCVLLEEGHQLRLEISSSAFPKFDRNLNTGGPIGKETEGIVAVQTVYHDRAHPSRVSIPVVPRPHTE